MAGFLSRCQSGVFLRFFVNFNDGCFCFHSSNVTFFELTSVECIQQDLFQLGDQWVARVRTSTLVIECIFRQLINVCQEVSFLNTRFADRLRNAQFSLQAFQPCQQFLDLSSSTVARCAQTQVVCDFSVTTTCLRTVVLAE